MQYYIQRIQKTIDFIDQNLSNEISLDQLASLAFCSKFHYHRTFRAMVGESVMEYIRKRRVSFAANEILNSKKKLIEIAYSSGFSSQVDFSRTFKRIYGITPMECRRKVKTVELYDKVNLVERSLPYGKSPLLVGPTIIERKSLNVVGIVLKSSFEDNFSNFVVQDLWREFNARRHLIKGVIDPYTDYGISYSGRYRKYFNYIAGVEVADLDHIPAGMEGRVIPNCRYAVFKFKGIKDGLIITEEFYKALDYIYGQWYPSSDYEVDLSNDLMEVCKCNKDLSNDSMDIYLPIK